MAFCPSCGYEYEKRIRVCPDCDVELVDELLEEHFDGEMVEVYRSHSAADAGLIKEILHDEAIFSALSNELGSVLLGSSAGEMGEVRVFVGDKDAERARELVKAYLEDDGEGDDVSVCANCGAQVDPDEDSCPNCDEQFEEE